MDGPSRQPYHSEAQNCAVDGDMTGAAVVSHFASVVVSLLAERTSARPKDADAQLAAQMKSDIIDAFVVAALAGTSRAFDALLGHFRKNRISFEMVADFYIPEAARQMGESWLNDELSWLDVSFATARLQSLLRELGLSWAADQSDAQGMGTILLLVPQGEQHTLGPMVAMGQLRRLGVSVCLRFAPTNREVTELMQDRQFDGIFISVATEPRVQSAMLLVRFLRALVRDLPPIVIGGQIVNEKPQLTSCIGADFSCKDAQSAIDVIGLNK